MGEAKKILGMEICRDKAHGKFSLSQKQYLKKVQQQFGMTKQKNQWVSRWLLILSFLHNYLLR